MYIDSKDGREIKSSTVRRGGPGGAFHRFELENGEHFVSVAGRCEEGVITQLYFVTNRGEPYYAMHKACLYLIFSRSCEQSVWWWERSILLGSGATGQKWKAFPFVVSVWKEVCTITELAFVDVV
jgi:hypothetical protein